MFGLVSFTSVALLAASSVSAVSIPLNHRSIKRSTDAPSTYAEGYLEDYDVYHTRYLALDCEAQHDTAFFDSCCHPLLSTESLSDRPAECTPSAASSSAAAAASTASIPVADFATSSSSSSSFSSSSSISSSSSSSSYVAPTTTTHKAHTTSSSSSAPAATSSASSGGGSITGGFGTFFYQNGVAGACGTVHSDYDLIVAMDSARYEAEDLCGKQIQITNTANGKSVTVTVADECPTCDNSNSIDMSVGAFTTIAEESTGLIDIEWNYIS